MDVPVVIKLLRQNSIKTVLDYNDPCDHECLDDQSHTVEAAVEDLLLCVAVSCIHTFHSIKVFCYVTCCQHVMCDAAGVS